MTEIIIGLIVTAISSMIVIICKNRKNIKPLKTAKVAKRFIEIGITDFYYNRKESLGNLGTTGMFISKATNEVYYVGCWLSSSMSGQDMSKRLYDIAMADVKIYICVMSPNNDYLEAIAEFFSETKESLYTKLHQTATSLLSIKEQLPEDKKGNLSVFVHNSIITNTFWALDPKIKDKSIFQLDHKTIYGLRYIKGTSI